MATMGITVTSQLKFSPDAIYLLEGANVKMHLLEIAHGKEIGEKMEIECLYINSMYE